MTGLVLGAGALAVGVSLGVQSCAATVTPQAVRSFQQPQNVDVVCLQVNDASGRPVTVTPRTQNECAPVPNGAVGASLPNHLYALVTQTARGELAVVDLTGGFVVDEDRATPGINFIPVGTNPTDVAVAPDGVLSFVSSADPNKPAIYAIDNRFILGDSVAPGPDASQRNAPLRLTDLLACALPQPPQALAIAPVPVAPAGEGGATAGDGSAGSPPYALVVLLRATPDAAAKVVTIDPHLFAPGDAGPTVGGEIVAGQLAPCSSSALLGATALSSALPASVPVGPTWPDGVRYADAGGAEPLPVACVAPALDAGSGMSQQGGSADASADGGLPDGSLPIPTPTFAEPRPSSMVMRDDLPILYVSDDALPMIHVIDLGDPTSPKELPPLFATSVLQPNRRVAVGGLAVSPPTRDYKRYLYAIDSDQGSIMVFDVSVGRPTTPASPMLRPHAELNPFWPPDRIVFSAPVVSVAFVQHDWPLVPPNTPDGGVNTDKTHAFQGLLCNPNPNAHPDPHNPNLFTDLGAYYRVDQAGVIQQQGSAVSFPARLRGVFGFATLSNGNMIAIDVDDWDAPCRRPEPMAVTPPNSHGVAGGRTGVLDEPQTDAGDLDPYHAPSTFQTGQPNAVAVTQETFFPVSAPNRMRSNFLLRSDPTTGQHAPFVSVRAQLFDVNGVPASGTITGGGTPPIMLPTALPAEFIDPSYIDNPTASDPSTFTSSIPALQSALGQGSNGVDGGGVAILPGSKATAAPAVRLAFDDPTAHSDDNWTVTFEGVLPTATQIQADIAPTDPTYAFLTFTSTGAGFCARGIEDRTIGAARGGLVQAAMKAAVNPVDGGAGPEAGVEAGAPTTAVPLFGGRTADYVQILDDLLPADDPYWSTPSDCWDDADAGAGDLAHERFQKCEDTFGAASSADNHLARDFPILNAYDDRLVVRSFSFQGEQALEQATNRVVANTDAANAEALKMARCCFHRQASFRVRAGGEWLTVGQNAHGLLHHVITDPSTSACVLSCDPRAALLNARAIEVPWGEFPACPQPIADLTLLTRDSPLAMRNPLFSFIMWSGCGTLSQGRWTLSTRDLTWKFSLGGGLTPLTISLAGSPPSSVLPESMRFIESLGQIAVVDGAQQGLVLIDLNTVNFAHSPYF